MKQKIQHLIALLELQPHPEGGFYKEAFRSKDKVTVLHERYGEDVRSASTSIYFLLMSDIFSSWHKLKSDEIWNYHLGGSVTVMTINHSKKLHRQVLGDPLQNAEASYQIVIPAGTWFCAYVDMENNFSLMGCTVSPGFEFADFQLGNRQELMATFPEHSSVIHQYTRQ